jgi:uncharacterized protein YdgA (DUF945 family)
MKNFFKPFIAIFLLSIFIAGCKKDEEATVKNYFNYNGTEFILSQGFLENYGKSSAEEGNNIDLNLLSSTFTIHEKNGEVDSVSGTGDALYFEIFTSLPDKLDVRDYTYDGTESYAAGTFDIGMIGMGLNWENETGTIFDITGGKVSVTSNGAEYEITINCTASNGKTITGYYKGPLKYYNYNKKKKSAERLQKNKAIF